MFLSIFISKAVLRLETCRRLGRPGRVCARRVFCQAFAGGQICQLYPLLFTRRGVSWPPSKLKSGGLSA